MQQFLRFVMPFDWLNWQFEFKIGTLVTGHTCAVEHCSSFGFQVRNPYGSVDGQAMQCSL